MKERHYKTDVVNAAAENFAADLSTARSLRKVLERCGKFAAYTTPRMKELLFLGDGKFRGTPVS